MGLAKIGLIVLFLITAVALVTFTGPANALPEALAAPTSFTAYTGAALQPGVQASTWLGANVSLNFTFVANPRNNITRFNITFPAN